MPRSPWTGRCSRSACRSDAKRRARTCNSAPAGDRQANRDAPIFDELRGIVLKTFGVADHVKSALAPLAKRIQAAFIYGSVAKGTDTAKSDIDLMIVSDDISYPDVIQVLTKAESEVRRAINPSVYSPSSWRRKLADDRGFVRRVMEQPRIFLIGSDDDLPEPRKSRKNR